MKGCKGRFIVLCGVGVEIAMIVQINIFLACTLISSLAFAADGPDLMKSLTQANTSREVYNQNLRQHRKRISIQRGNRLSNHHPSSLRDTRQNQYAQKSEAPPVLDQSPSQSTNEPKNVVDFQRAIGMPQGLNVAKSTGKAENEQVTVKSPDLPELKQIIEHLQGDLVKLNAKIAELENSKFDSQRQISDKPIGSATSRPKIEDVEKASENRDAFGQKVEQIISDLPPERIEGLGDSNGHLEFLKKQAEPEGDKHQTEQVRNEGSTKIAMAYAQPQTDKGAVGSTNRNWQLLAYIGIPCFVILVMLTRRRTVWKACP
jgi:hypothetical protein